MDGLRRLKKVVLQTTVLLEEVGEHDTHPPSPHDEAKTDVTLSPASVTILTSGLLWLLFLRD